MSKEIISNPKEFEQIKVNFKADGFSKIHVLADFDRTMTKVFHNGQKIHSLISILREENYLTPDYPTKAKELLEKYHPIEVDPNISKEEKTKAMAEWWAKHFELLIKSKLNIKDLESIMDSDRVQLRDGVMQFLDTLNVHKIPLIIMSASGLGGDSISLYLKKRSKLTENIHIVSNTFNWDEKGFLASVQQPVIHVMNKDETVVKYLPFFDLIKDRKNVLLLGDNQADIDMIKGFDYDNLLKVGFLNDEVEKNLISYQQDFDVVIPGDGSFDFVNQFLKDIFN